MVWFSEGSEMKLSLISDNRLLLWDSLSFLILVLLMEADKHCLHLLLETKTRRCLTHDCWQWLHTVQLYQLVKIKAGVGFRRPPSCSLLKWNSLALCSWDVQAAALIQMCSKCISASNSPQLFKDTCPLTTIDSPTKVYPPGQSKKGQC